MGTRRKVAIWFKRGKEFVVKPPGWDSRGRPDVFQTVPNDRVGAWREDGFEGREQTEGNGVVAMAGKSQAKQ